MKQSNSLLAKLRHFFNKKQKRQEAKRKHLKVILKKLKNEQVALRGKLSKAKDSRKSQFERHVKLLHEQRKKGIALLKGLRSKS